MKNLSNLKVAVTGALGGIGIATLKHLESVGAQLVAIDLLDSNSAHKILAENGISVDSYHQVDITDSAAIGNLLDSLKSGSVPNALVSLAGIVRVGEIHEQSEDVIQRWPYRQRWQNPDLTGLLLLRPLLCAQPRGDRA